MKNTTSTLRALNLLILGAWLGGPALAEDLVKVAVPQRGTWETSVADMGEPAKIFAKHGI